MVAVQQQEQAAPLTEEAVPVDGKLRGPWKAHELCCESRDIGETSNLDPNATPYMPRQPTAATADCTTETDLSDGQIQNTLTEGFDFNCAVDLDLEPYETNNGNNDQLNMNSFDTSLITVSDYLQDEEFKFMYTYLWVRKLTNDCKTDRFITLISDQYYLKNDLLYRISLPRSKKLSRVQPNGNRQQ